MEHKFFAEKIADICIAKHNATLSTAVLLLTVYSCLFENAKLQVVLVNAIKAYMGYYKFTHFNER